MGHYQVYFEITKGQVKVSMDTSFYWFGRRTGAWYVMNDNGDKWRRTVETGLLVRVQMNTYNTIYPDLFNTYHDYRNTT